MAEVRFCFGRGAQGFAHKLFNRDLQRSLDEHGKSAINNSPLSVGLLTGYSENCERNEAANAAHRVTPGFVTPVSEAAGDTWEKENIANYDIYHRLKLYSLDKNTRGSTAGVNPPRRWSTAKYRRTLRTFSPYSQCVSYGHRHCVFIREYSNSTRAEPLHKTKTGYYDILEILPTATQTQIKTAYYKQSFVYHPDRNAGSEGATVRFSEISEAYTVLGNKALRRKYDRGLLSLGDLVAPGNRSSSRDSGAESSAKVHTGTRRSVVDTDTRDGIFDFDKFFKSHYSGQLQKQRDIQARREEMLKEKSESREKKLGNVGVEVWAGLMLVMAMGLIFCLN